MSQHAEQAEPVSQQAQQGQAVGEQQKTAPAPAPPAGPPHAPPLALPPGPTVPACWLQALWFLFRFQEHGVCILQRPLPPSPCSIARSRNTASSAYLASLLGAGFVDATASRTYSQKPPSLHGQLGAYCSVEQHAPGK